jgi:hypothetical protein
VTDELSPASGRYPQWQFDLAWALADLHLSALVDDDFSPASGRCPQWEPAPLCSTVRPDSTGVWRPDWADTEPDPLPVPTIGWLTWHIDCPPQAGGAPRWSVAIDHLTGASPRDRMDITWPGSGPAAVARLRGLAARWRQLLAAADLTGPSSFPWGADAGRTVAHLATEARTASLRPDRGSRRNRDLSAVSR